MKNPIDIPYGYKILHIGSVTVYTGKIRVKTDDQQGLINQISSQDILAYTGTNSTVIITFSTTDGNTYRNLVNKVNDALYDIMSARLLTKYKQHELFTNNHY